MIFTYFIYIHVMICEQKSNAPVDYTHREPEKIFHWSFPHLDNLLTLRFRPIHLYSPWKSRIPNFLVCISRRHGIYNRLEGRSSGHHHHLRLDSGAWGRGSRLSSLRRSGPRNEEYHHIWRLRWCIYRSDISTGPPRMHCRLRKKRRRM